MTDSTDSSEPFAGILPETLAEAAIGLATAGPGGAVVGAIKPFMTRLIKLSTIELRAGDRKVETTWETAAESAQIPIDDLVDRAVSDPDRHHLGYSASEAARWSRTDAKLAVLGQALAQGLLTDDDAVIDTEQQVVDAVSQIERPHITVMWALRADSGAPDGWAPQSLTWEELNEGVKTYKKVLPRLLSVLEREGLVVRQSLATVVPSGANGEPYRPGREDYSGDFWSLTGLGLELLARLHRAGLESSGSVEAFVKP